MKTGQFSRTRESSQATTPAWLLAILAFSGIKVLFGLIGFIGGLDPRLMSPTPFPEAIFVLNMLVFAGSAAGLLIGGYLDRRAVYLAAVFLSIGSTFARRFLQGAAPVLREWFQLPIDLLALPDASAFLPLFIWLFVREFPRGPEQGLASRLFRIGLAVSSLAGLALFGANVALLFDGSRRLPMLWNILSWMRIGEKQTYYWMIVFFLLLLPLPLAIWKARTVPSQERRRLNLFVFGLVFGTAPIALEFLLEFLIPPWRTVMNIPANRYLMGVFFVYPLLLSVPIITSYSVLVHRVLDVRLIVRKALQYALARYTVFAAAFLPFAALVYYVYVHRQESVSNLFSGFSALGLAGATAAGLIMIRVRQDVLNAIDRRFFREQYNSQRILHQLVERSRNAGRTEELAELLRVEIDKALHVDTLDTLIIDGWKKFYRSAYSDRQTQPLSVTSTLGALLETTTEPLDVDLETPSPLLERLPLDEKQWLADQGARLLVPLFGSDGVLIGSLVLGSKKSELPFSREDRQLLGALGSSAGLTLENRLMREEPARRAGTEYRERAGVEERAATECAHCKVLDAPGEKTCKKCGHPLSPARVPYILASKFRFEHRVGSGGMGVVYRAVDLNLGRYVAIKTLPRVAPEYSLRLRREARAMAAVDHPNLASIFGAETWQGIPMLICEFLEGGTLSSRLERSPMNAIDVIDLGIALADGLHKLHSSSLLHRDIKPSNIGFTRSGVPKLLDFGLARIIDDSRVEAPLEDLGAGRTVKNSAGPTMPAPLTSRSQVLGTPAYMSPEAINARQLSSGFDLWSLNVVLIECLSGQNPFSAPTIDETFRRVSNVDIPSLHQILPSCPQSLVSLLSDGLARNERRRPATAMAVQERLKSARRDLAVAATR